MANEFSKKYKNLIFKKEKFKLEFVLCYSAKTHLCGFYKTKSNLFFFLQNCVNIEYCPKMLKKFQKKKNFNLSYSA